MMKILAIIQARIGAGRSATAPSLSAIPALAKYRGAAVGFSFAEAFYAQRILI